MERDTLGKKEKGEGTTRYHLCPSLSREKEVRKRKFADWVVRHLARNAPHITSKRKELGRKEGRGRRGRDDREGGNTGKKVGGKGKILSLPAIYFPHMCGCTTSVLPCLQLRSA